jgi:hypothetical protein
MGFWPGLSLPSNSVPLLLRPHVALAVKQRDHRASEARQLTEHWNDWFADSQKSLIERYVDGQLHIGLRRALWDETEWGFVIRRCDEGDRLKGNPSRPLEGYLTGVVDDKEQPAMLAHDVELVESPERRISSLVWLQRFKDATFSGGKPLYEFGTLIAPRAEDGFANSNRKIRVFWLRYAEAIGKGRGENIETAADCVDVAADLDNERKGKRLFFDRYYHLMLGVRLKINHVGIDVSFQPGIDATLEGWEVGHGPINAGLGVQEISAHEQRPQGWVG